jgi:predicted Zn-dependent protease
MFLSGRVATSDGTPLPNNVMVERLCDAGVRQQVYATSRGDFTMEMGSKNDSLLDASGDRSSSSQYGNANRDSVNGVSRRELANCELRASVSGFQSSVINLVNLNPGSKTVDVGSIVVQRRTKIEGATLNAALYKAPKNARKAYENGLDAERKGKLPNARTCFEKAVQLYPSFTNAWFQLGTVLQQQNQRDEARAAFARAATIDTKFLPPYLSLASLAFEAGDWTEVLTLTAHIVDLDPMNHMTGYVLDLDPLDYAEVYFYNSVANYQVNHIDAAEKSGLKAEHLDLRPRFPQLHLLLAEIFARKNNYPSAISEIQTYLDLAPNAKDADQVRQRLAKLQTLNSSASSSGKTDHN